MATPLKTLQEWQTSDYIRCFKAYKWLLLITTLLGWGVTDLSMQKIPNEYEATSKIRVDPNRADPIQFRDTSSFYIDEGNFLKTEMKMITSPMILERVIKDYSLTLFPEFQDAENPVTILEEMIKISIVLGTNLFEITAKADDPKLVALIANGIADTYMLVNLEEQQKQTTGGVEWLHAEIGKMEAKVHAAQLALQGFMEKYGNIDFSEGQQNMTIQNLKDYNDALMLTEKQLIDASAQYLERHPVVQGLKDRRLELDQRIKESEQRILEMRRLSIQYDSLKKEVDTLQEVHDVLLTRLNQLSVEEGLTTNNVRVVSYAEVPAGPSAPDRPGVAMRGGALGMVLGMVLATLLQSMRRTITSQQDFETLFEIPFLGYIPVVPRHLLRYGRARSVFATEATSAVAESIRSIRTTLEFLVPEKPSVVVMVTSALPEEGKSFISANLAIALSESGKKIALIDADLRRPSVHRALGISQTPGLCDYLGGFVDWGTLLQAVSAKSDHGAKIDVIPAGHIATSPADLIASEKLPALLEMMKTKYQYIVIDTPPVSPVVDAMIIARLVDAVIYVVRSGSTHQEPAVRGKKRLMEIGKAKQLFGVLNRHREEFASHYYKYYQYRRGPRKKSGSS